MSIRIDPNQCTGCGACIEVCPGNLLKREPEGKAFLKHPEECWGCASCLKECRFGAIAYYLGADIGGMGSTMQTEIKDGLRYWTITKPGQKPITITVNPKNANEY